MLCSDYRGKLKLQYFVIDQLNEDDGGSSSHSIV